MTAVRRRPSIRAVPFSLPVPSCGAIPVSNPQFERRNIGPTKAKYGLAAIRTDPLGFARDATAFSHDRDCEVAVHLEWIY
ncbi:hypothetical protein AUEXF2481DRAFT_44765 [Aureobasidium subglaciale EXF-2481]|uniref:Uncharacterized protein n=1 Tax=Aureobasidium subglaciale (strain EXF-2481) TaxID=1043005 RepID=A0A074Y447_AURSE|nr:uncharacterized protein AUEXF2481DRAFT_44765 [Aureobasidium subglaciale EXF-2481]KEQ90714.1 hypothetical protein AUEXF2481DRAFT_44765 [Aureobasidium subglaciale EXF-2481]